MRNNEVMLGIHCCLDVVADDPRATGLHRTGIRIGQGNLLVRCCIELNLNGLKFFHLCLQGSDLVL